MRASFGGVTVMGTLLLLATSSVAGADREPPASNVLIAGTYGGKAAYASGVIVAANTHSVVVVIAQHSLIIERPHYLMTCGEELAVESVARVRGHDQALVTARRPHGHFAVAIPALATASGTPVTIWGPIAKLPFTEHTGATRDIDERIHDAPSDALAIDCAACDHGDSGAGVYDAGGRLVGIVTRGYFDGERKVLVLVERVGPDLLARSPGTL